MLEGLLGFAQELKKSKPYQHHLCLIEAIKNELDQNNFKLLNDLRPNFSHSLGYIAAIETLKANKNRTDTVPSLQTSIQEILAHPSLDEFNKSCLDVGQRLNHLFMDIVRPVQTVSDNMQLLSPTGRRLFHELQAMVNRAGLFRSIFYTLVPFEGKVPEKAAVIDTLINEDDRYFPFKRSVRKAFQELSRSNTELAKYFEVHLAFINFNKISVQLLYELIINNVPTLPIDVMSAHRTKRIGDFFKVKCSTQEFVLSTLPTPRITFCVLTDEQGKLLGLLMPTRRNTQLQTMTTKIDSYLFVPNPKLEW